MTYYRGGGVVEIKRTAPIEVIEYERDILENSIEVCSPEHLHTVGTMQWLSTTREYARRFGYVQKVTLPEHAVIVAKDADDGVLVLY